jgi:hypothetical protein
MKKQTLVQTEALTTQPYLSFPYNNFLLFLQFSLVKLMHEKKYKNYKMVRGAYEFLLITKC